MGSYKILQKNDFPVYDFHIHLLTDSPFITSFRTANKAAAKYLLGALTSGWCMRMKSVPFTNDIGKGHMPQVEGAFE
jgi:hypothetical protein